MGAALWCCLPAGGSRCDAIASRRRCGRRLSASQRTVREGRASLRRPPRRRILDNLPVAMVKSRKEDALGNIQKTYERGFYVGFKATLEVRRPHAAPPLP